MDLTEKLNETSIILPLLLMVVLSECTSQLRDA
jgi:hypothetical protein